MKSARIADHAGLETRVVILDSGEEAFAALTKFANEAAITAALVRPMAHRITRRPDHPQHNALDCLERPGVQPVAAAG